MRNRSAVRLLAGFGVVAFVVFATNILSPRPTLGYTPPVFVRAVPEPRNIRSFHVEIPAGTSRDIFAVPTGKIFVITDVLMPSTNSQGEVQFLENAQNGMLRFRITNTSELRHFTFVSGVPYGPGTSIHAYVVPLVNATLRFTISGYLADA